MTEIAVRTLEETQIVAAGRTLASAFHDDPLQMHVFPDPKERAQRSPEQFSVFVRHGFLFGEAFATEEIMGVSAWMPPGNATTSEQASASGFRQLPRLMGNEPFERFGTVLDYLSATHHKRIPVDHWYLMVVGVLAGQQGCGLGQALLKPIMTRADAAGIPICLDTAQPKVKTFYEKLGFRPVVETLDARSGLRFWTYQRDPT